jgi:predicted glycosyltransferase involved in capsule biosynthesis
MKLGEEARKHIKGHDVNYYLDILKTTREKTISEFKKRDDDWLMTLDKEWGWNNYGKWFHVCEHESNHNGQIKWIKSRLPGAKPGND